MTSGRTGRNGYSTRGFAFGISALACLTGLVHGLTHSPKKNATLYYDAAQSYIARAEEKGPFDAMSRLLLEAARDSLLQSARLNPSETSVWKALETVYADLGHDAAAAQAQRVALALDPNRKHNARHADPAGLALNFLSPDAAQ